MSFMGALGQGLLGAVGGGATAYAGIMDDRMKQRAEMEKEDRIAAMTKQIEEERAQRIIQAKQEEESRKSDALRSVMAPTEHKYEQFDENDKILGGLLNTFGGRTPDEKLQSMAQHPALAEETANLVGASIKNDMEKGAKGDKKHVLYPGSVLTDNDGNVVHTNNNVVHKISDVNNSSSGGGSGGERGGGKSKQLTPAQQSANAEIAAARLRVEKAIAVGKRPEEEDLTLAKKRRVGDDPQWTSWSGLSGGDVKPRNENSVGNVGGGTMPPPDVKAKPTMAQFQAAMAKAASDPDTSRGAARQKELKRLAKEYGLLK